MKLKFLGAAGTVTGSGYLFTNDHTKFIIDFGMFQGTKAEESLNTQPLDFLPSEVDAILLTHAHLDHCGRLPLLVKKGFRGPIYATEATQELAEIVLFDSAKIALSDQENKLINPLYTEHDVVETIKLFKTIDYHEPQEFKHLKFEYINAGHILGSASIKITTPQNQSIIFSGDIGAYPDLLIPHTEFFENANFVVMESTYGGRAHPNENPIELFAEHLNSADATKGTLLIPAFAIQKTQVLLCLIKELKAQKKIRPDLPVFLDSPMATETTKIYADHSYLFNDRFQNDSTPFDSPALNVALRNKQSSQIKRTKGAKVIIAGSGMMTGGRVLSHAKEYLPDPNASVLFVGYQAAETLGRDLKQGATEVKIDSQKYPVYCKIKEINSLSSHADEPRLLNWLKNIKNINTLFLTHGDDDSRIKLASEVRRKLAVPEIILPKLNEEINLEV